MYMTSFAASQNSKFSIAEALAVGTESIAPVLGHGRIISCHSPVAQIKKRGATVRLHVPAFFSPHASQPAIAVCSILPVWVGTERNHDGLSAIHLAG